MSKDKKDGQGKNYQEPAPKLRQEEEEPKEREKKDKEDKEHDPKE